MSDGDGVEGVPGLAAVLGAAVEPVQGCLEVGAGDGLGPGECLARAKRQVSVVAVAERQGAQQARHASPVRGGGVVDERCQERDAMAACLPPGSLVVDVPLELVVGLLPLRRLGWR